MSVTAGITFLSQFSVGEFNLNNPGVNIISVTSTAAGDHAAKNLTTTPLRETWRSVDAATPQEIIIEANDRTVAPNVFAILNHNLSSTAVVQLQGNNSNVWSAPGFTANLVWNKKHIVLLEDVGQPWRYYKIKITDPSNPCGYIDIGKIVGGTAFQFMNNEDMADDFSSGKTDLAYQMKSEGFFRASNERVKTDSLSLSFPKLSSVTGKNANYVGITELAEFVGETLPFLTIVDPLDPYFKLIWGQLRTMPKESFTINRFVNLSLDIDEVY